MTHELAHQWFGNCVAPAADLGLRRHRQSEVD